MAHLVRGEGTPGFILQVLVVLHGCTVILLTGPPVLVLDTAKTQRYV